MILLFQIHVVLEDPPRSWRSCPANVGKLRPGVVRAGSRRVRVRGSGPCAWASVRPSISVMRWICGMTWRSWVVRATVRRGRFGDGHAGLMSQASGPQLTIHQFNSSSRVGLSMDLVATAHSRTPPQLSSHDATVRSHGPAIVRMSGSPARRGTTSDRAAIRGEGGPLPAPPPQFGRTGRPMGRESAW